MKLGEKSEMMKPIKAKLDASQPNRNLVWPNKITYEVAVHVIYSTKDDIRILIDKPIRWPIRRQLYDEPWISSRIESDNKIKETLWHIMFGSNIWKKIRTIKYKTKQTLKDNLGNIAQNF